MPTPRISAAYSALLTAGALLFTGSAWSSGQTFWVTNDGADSASCGNRATPCRSISQAIENASAGDHIAVGAGTYGDISGDGTFSHPGDEHPQTLAGVGPAFGQQSGCIICITKPLTIKSLHGASVTVIAGIPSSTFPNTVQIASAGVVFGTDGSGFTVTGGNGTGVLVDQNFMSPPQKNITVQGNVDIGDGTGFAFNGLEFTDRPCPDPSCEATATVFFLEDRAVGNAGAGFAVTDNTFFYAGRLVLKNDVASGGGTGFSISPGFQSETLVTIGTGNVSLTDNVAIHNGYGFSTVESGPMVGNTAVGNSQVGFVVVPGSIFQGNSAIGNGGPGMIVQDSGDIFSSGVGQVPPQFSVFSENNFYGNDRNRPTLMLSVPLSSLPGFNPGPSAHCGVLNVGALAAALPGNGPPPTATQQAFNNFWGSANGPSPTGPGDAAGGVCDQNGGVTVAKPFATVDFGITTAPP